MSGGERGRSPSPTFARLVALSALSGLTVQFAATYAANPTVPATLWILLRYFTIIANILVALIFAGLAVRRPRFAIPTIQGGVTLLMLLVAIVYQVLLRGTLVQTGPDRLADLFLHSVTPALVVVHWAVYAPKGGLRWRDPLLWAVIPILYLSYALARGAADGIYPYPFLDIGRIGAAQVAANAVLIAVGFLAAAFALVWFDRRLGGRRRVRARGIGG